MKFLIESQLNPQADLSVYAVTENGDFSSSLSALDKKYQGFFSQQKEKNNLPQKSGESALFYLPDGQRVVIQNIKDNPENWEKAGQSLQKIACENKYLKINCFIDEIAAERNKAIQHFVQSFYSADYHFQNYKSEDTHKTISLFFNELKDENQVAIKRASAFLAGSYLCRDLVNTPPNVCNPEFLAQTAKNLAKKYEFIKTEVLNLPEIEALEMGGILAVSQGSATPPRFIISHYQHPQAKNEKPIVLVGKGVTFDTGGISIKPAAGMDEMKGDMGGAAAVLGAIEALAYENLPLNVVALIPSVENMPSGTACRPGDIFKSFSGKTVEILNTDAEGRLILCDALTYAEQYQPQAVIDLATLTGAVVIALGSHRSGLMGNNEELQEALFQAGERSLDRAWKLPIDEVHREALKSPFADIANISGTREAGSLTAGAFLSFFTENYPWAHLDIAAVSFKSSNPKGGTGRPVALLMEYFRSVA